MLCPLVIPPSSHTLGHTLGGKTDKMWAWPARTRKNWFEKSVAFKVTLHSRASVAIKSLWLPDGVAGGPARRPTRPREGRERLARTRSKCYFESNTSFSDERRARQPPGVTHVCPSGDSASGQRPKVSAGYTPKSGHTFGGWGGPARGRP